MFCPKCGSLLIPKKDKNNKRIFQCSCGHKQKEMEETIISEKINANDKVEVIDKEIDPNPLVDAECPKCKNGKARYWTAQTRSSDEPETKFFKCEKCRHIWRDYG